nr:hypothetical protein [Tanacetum cinerariifolium]
MYWRLGPSPELVPWELGSLDVALVWVLSMLPLSCSTSKLEAVVIALTKLSPPPYGQPHLQQYEGIKDVGEEEVVEVVTTAKMIIYVVVDARQVTTTIVDIPVSVAETIVTTAPTITAESTKTNVEVTQAPKRKRFKIQEPEEQQQQKQLLHNNLGFRTKTVQESSSKRTRDDLKQERSKKQKMEDDKECAELKKCLEIIPDDGDDVTIDATYLSFKSPTIIDYKIYKEGKKNYF